MPRPTTPYLLHILVRRLYGARPDYVTLAILALLRGLDRQATERGYRHSSDYLITLEDLQSAILTRLNCDQWEVPHHV